MPHDVHEVVAEHIRRWRASDNRNNHRRYQDLGQPHVVTLSSEHGAGDTEVARRVGELLGVPVFEREVISAIAASASARAAAVDSIDPRGGRRVDERLAPLLRKSEFNQQQGLRALCQVVLSLWQHSPCVLLGHGAVHLVPRSHALAVRLIAPEEVRWARVASDEAITIEEARRRSRQADFASARHHGRFFDADLDDLRRFDLALDTSSLRLDGCAQIIVQGFRDKFGGRWRTVDHPAPSGAVA